MHGSNKKTGKKPVLSYIDKVRIKVPNDSMLYGNDLPEV